METRILGTDLEVSAIGLGCMGLSHAYGAPTEEGAAVQLIHDAHELGYTFFDTAEIYGADADPHHNERIVGEALKGIRDQVVIATKCDLSFGPVQDGTPSLVPDARRQTIRRSIEGRCNVCRPTTWTCITCIGLILVCSSRTWPRPWLSLSAKAR